jgi:hypothetical protein
MPARQQITRDSSSRRLGNPLTSGPPPATRLRGRFRSGLREAGADHTYPQVNDQHHEQ